MADLKHSAIYEANMERVWMLLTNEAFLGDFARDIGATDHDATVERLDGGARTHVRWVVPTRDLPGLVRKFVGSSLDVSQAVTWGARISDRRSGELALNAVASRSASLHGITTLQPHHEHSRLIVEGKVVIDVAAVGGQIAKLAVSFLKEVLDDQAKLANRWLRDGYGLA